MKVPVLPPPLHQFVHVQKLQYSGNITLACPGQATRESVVELGPDVDRVSVLPLDGMLGE